MAKSKRPQSHKEFTPLLPCEGKNRYSTQKEAQGAAEFHMLENMNIELEVYECATCGYWHMTSVKEYNWRKDIPKR